MNLLNLKYNHSAYYKFYFLFTIIVVVNIMTITSISTILVTLPEYIIVLYLFVKGDIKSSVLLHLVFISLSLSAEATLGMMEGEAFSLYNYAGIKLVGPVRASYALNIIYCLALLRSPHLIRREMLFYKLYKTMLYLGCTAMIIGLIGFLINPYYSIDGFLTYGIYAFVVVTTMFILMRVADYKFITAAYHLVIIAIMSGIAGSFFCYITGSVVSHYSVYDVAYLADISFIALALIVGIPYIRPRGLLWLSLLLYGILILTALGGKTVFGLAFCIVVLIYLLFFDKNTIIKIERTNKLLRPMVIMAAIAATLYVVRHFTSDSMAAFKLASAASMFSGNLEDISESPYIRIASLINILYEGLSNPFVLLFGNGYGGYFEDKLGLFAGLDLTVGAWKENVVATGRFPSGHDTMVTVPLFNGLIGLFLVIKICWLYIKRIPFNYLNSVAFFWIVLMFYFNTNFAFIGLFALVAAEYDVANQNSTLSPYGIK